MYLMTFMTKTKNQNTKRQNNHITLFVGRLINTSTIFCRPIVIYSDTSTLAQGNIGIITISWHKRLSFQISETISILHSVLAQIRPRCRWPLPVWTSLKEALTKHPIKHTLITPISLSGDSEASKPACFQDHSTSESPLSWRNVHAYGRLCLYFVVDCPAKHKKFKCRAVLMCQRLY